MVLMGTTVQVGQFSAPGSAQEEQARVAMEEMGITHLAERGYQQISGGERQLVLIARALAQKARIVIMDEPTANLDYGNQLRVLGRVKSLAKRGYTIIQSTHSPDHAFLFADRVLALHDRRIAACGTPGEVLTSELIHKLYGIKVRVECRNGHYSSVPELEDWAASAHA
jgi:iron complex transport system ATP-binding protein